MHLSENIGESVLGSLTKIRILTILLKWSEGELTERQLAGLCELSTFGVRHALADLERSSIVTKKIIGKANVWGLNRKSYPFKMIYPVLEQLISLEKPLAYVKKLLVSRLQDKKVGKIILFGSTIEQDSDANDIDVCILLKPDISAKLRSSFNLKEIEEQLAAEIAGTLGMRLELQIFTDEEWKKKISSPLGQAILKGKEIYPREEI